MEIKTFSDEYFDAVKKALDETPREKIEEIADLMWNAYQEDKTIYVFGNGGSASTASHFVTDIAKGTVTGCGEFTKEMRAKKRFKMISLNDSLPIMLAWANDEGYESIFKEQLENFVQEGDLVIGISGSGNSKNVLNAIEFAKSKGAKTIGLTGFDGGKLKDLADTALVVPNHFMRQIEDVHLVLTHTIAEYFFQKLLNE